MRRRHLEDKPGETRLDRQKRKNEYDKTKHCNGQMRSKLGALRLDDEPERASLGQPTWRYDPGRTSLKRAGSVWRAGSSGSWICLV